MLRYYLIATVIVVVIGSIVFAHRIATNEWNLRARPTGTPTITRGSDEEPAASSQNFVGEGPWVLSALPGCFNQQSSIVGPSLQLRSHVPPDRERIAPGTILHRGSCDVLVRVHDVWVYRRGDRLRVPADARLYDTPKGLTLVFEHAGHMEIRVY